MTTQNMPGLVRAQVQVHLAQTLLKLEGVRAELDRTTTSAGRSRVLRGLRTQLTAQLDAWEYLAMMTEQGHYRAYQEVNDVPEPSNDEHRAIDPARCSRTHPETGEQCRISPRLVHREHVTDTRRIFEDPEPSNDNDHRSQGCTGAWEVGSDGISRKCADCKEYMDDLTAPDKVTGE